MQPGMVKITMPCVVLCPGYHGHAIARSLGRLGIPVYGIHADRHSPAATSRYWRGNFFWKLYYPDRTALLERLLRLGKQIGSQPLLIPTDDPSTLFVNEHAGVLREVFRFPQCPTGLVHRLTNKRSVYMLCKQHAIPTPECYFPTCAEDVARLIPGITFPVVLKGYNTGVLLQKTGHRMAIVSDAEALLRRYRQMECPDSPIMIQEYIPGGVEHVWMFNGYFDENSDCLFEMTGRKLRQYPAYTGMTSLGICARNEEVSRLTKKFMKAIGYRGILDIGFKYHPIRKTYYLLDPNPRIGTTFRLFVDSAGIDVVRALYFDFSGQKFAAGELPEGRKWLAENFDIISAITSMRDGKLRFRDWVRSFRGIAEAQWFAGDDVRPFLSIWLFSIKKALRQLAGALRRRRRDGISGSGQPAAPARSRMIWQTIGKMG